tara:strand:- start:153 stop:1649 length:1497 start_codon:yes stop_codon:yes gene_type:complete
MLIFKFGTDGSAYSRGLDKMRAETKSWASGIKGMIGGALAGGAIIGGLKSMAEHAKEVNKQAELFGTSFRVVQQFGAAAEASGFTLENLADAMHDMTEKAQDAANGNQNYADAFAMMNLEAEEFMNMNFEEKVRAFGDGLKYASEQGLEFLAANELAGGAAQELIGTFKDGGDAFFRLAAGMNTLTDSQIQTGLKLNKVWASIKNVAIGATSATVEWLQKMTAVGVAAGATIWVNISETIKGLGDRFKLLGGIIESALKGDLDGVKKAFYDMGGVGDKVADRIETKMKGVRGALKESIDELNAKERTDDDVENDKKSVAKAIAEMEKQKKIAEEIAKLKKEVIAADDKAAFDALSHQEKMLELVEKEAELRAIMAEGVGKGGQAELDAFKALKELQKLEKDRKVLVTTEEKRVVDVGEKRKTEREKRESAISNLQSSGVDSGVISSSLRSIGGGGNAVMTRDPALQIAKRQERILEMIAQNTAINAKESEGKGPQKEF